MLVSNMEELVRARRGPLVWKVRLGTEARTDPREEEGRNLSYRRQASG